MKCDNCGAELSPERIGVLEDIAHLQAVMHQTPPRRVCLKCPTGPKHKVKVPFGHERTPQHPSTHARAGRAYSSEWHDR
jgi:hypothetical protein